MICYCIATSEQKGPRNKYPQIPKFLDTDLRIFGPQIPKFAGTTPGSFPGPLLIVMVCVDVLGEAHAARVRGFRGAGGDGSLFTTG
jgi:hypothetical protein